MLEVDDLVIYKVLVDLHFLLKVSHLTLVDKQQNPRAGFFNGMNTFLLKTENLTSYLILEGSVAVIVDFLPLAMQLFSIAGDSFHLLNCTFK